jgi:hypothetical protein
MLALSQAQAALALKASNTKVTKEEVAALLAPVKGVTFAQLLTVTDVDTSKDHKGVHIQKVSSSNVQLFNNLQASTDVYANAVKRSGNKIEANDKADVAAFATGGNYFHHTACHSIAKHNTDDRHYLWAIYNGSQSMYFVNGAVADKQQVALYLTPSKARDLLAPKATVVNVTTGVEHSVVVRTVGLDSIVSLKAVGQTLAV